MFLFKLRSEILQQAIELSGGTRSARESGHELWIEQNFENIKVFSIVFTWPWCFDRKIFEKKCGKKYSKILHEIL